MRNYLTITILLIIVGCSVSKKTSAVNPFQGDTVGCGNFIVYRFSEDGDQYISVSFNANEVEFEDSFERINAQYIEVKWEKFAGDMRSAICNDVMGEKPNQLMDQIAKSGSVSIRVNEAEQKKKENNEAYKVTVTLKDLVFENLSVDYLQIENVVVGWLPG
ncbi:MAG: hypothetical protein ABJG78_20605 [Cyclobacteriaceae bacterium]